eukprot:GHVP01067942.1.p1 GENE.GHVP01067942.1~~GHVP01067942.1.p1  ORF type:complete len:338 (+),score=63.99 GHVP01067942.1:63-1076(+)
MSANKKLQKLLEKAEEKLQMLAVGEAVCHTAEELKSLRDEQEARLRATPLEEKEQEALRAERLKVLTLAYTARLKYEENEEALSAYSRVFSFAPRQAEKYMTEIAKKFEVRLLQDKGIPGVNYIVKGMENNIKSYLEILSNKIRNPLEGTKRPNESGVMHVLFYYYFLDPAILEYNKRAREINKDHPIEFELQNFATLGDGYEADVLFLSDEKNLIVLEIKQSYRDLKAAVYQAALYAFYYYTTSIKQPGTISVSLVGISLPLFDAQIGIFRFTLSDNLELIDSKLEIGKNFYWDKAEGAALLLSYILPAHPVALSVEEAPGKEEQLIKRIKSTENI